MSGYHLELPTIQNWSCHSCSGCCRQHRIAITAAEHERLAGQQWTEADGIAAGQPLFVRMGRWPFRRWWRLAHQPDGRCVFLDDQGLCRIHARFGEPAKPLACRIYPYAFHPKGQQVVVGLRYSCPSVVRNQGASLSSQRGELKSLAAQVIPANVTQARPPRLHGGLRLDWPDTLRVVDALLATLREASSPIAIRLLRALHWLELLEQAKLDSIRGPRLQELLDLLRSASAAELPGTFDLDRLPEPTRVGGTLFRLHAGQYGRIDMDVAGRWLAGRRLKLLWTALRLARGGRELPGLSPEFPPLSFAALERRRDFPSFDFDEMLSRYFLVKLQGMSFCGRAYYDESLVDGFRSLALMFPVVCWLARWRAAVRGDGPVTIDDVVVALTTADHHHGYSPALGTFAAKGRLRTLHKLGDIPRFIARLGPALATHQPDG
ncbi:MAG: YkgJ family cysteine cluster protein [Planctomycetaceae bacterium]